MLGLSVHFYEEEQGVVSAFLVMPGLSFFPFTFHSEGELILKIPHAYPQEEGH